MNNKMPILIIVSLALSGCNLIEPVMPWEKAYLSVPAMTFENDKAAAKTECNTRPFR